MLPDLAMVVRLVVAFLCSGLVAEAFITSPPPLASYRAVRGRLHAVSMTERPLGVGVIGCGRIGQVRAPLALAVGYQDGACVGGGVG
jgi:hypothetical protein